MRTLGTRRRRTKHQSNQALGRGSHLLDELVDLRDALVPVGAESVVALPDVFRLRVHSLRTSMMPGSAQPVFRARSKSTAVFATHESRAVMTAAK